MKKPPPKLSALLTDLRKLRAEIRELQANPQPRTDPLDAFRAVFRDGVKDEPDSESTEPPSS